MASLDEELGLDEETDVARLARELAEADIDLIAALRRVREARQLSQSDVGARMGVSQATVSAFESGDSEPRLSTVRRYAFALGAKVQHCVIADGVEFTRSGLTATWTPPSTPDASRLIGQLAVGIAADALRADFAVAA